jgi:hypothetical protein
MDIMCGRFQGKGKLTTGYLNGDFEQIDWYILAVKIRNVEIK